jgi:hypothetical protein
VLAHARVVTRGEPGGADAAGEGEQGREAEAPVAADARVGRLPPLVAADERRHDRAAEALSQVERHVRRAELVAELARGDDRGRRAAHPLAVGPGGIRPETERDADGLVPGVPRLEERNRAVDAAAHRHGDAARARPRGDRGAEGVVERVERERLAGDGGRLEQPEARHVAAERLRAATLAAGGDDLPLRDREGDPGEVAVACGVADQLSRGHQK